MAVLSVLFFFFLCSSSSIAAQSFINSSADTDFSCSSDSPVSCQTYVAYRVRPPQYASLKNISELFKISPAEIANASNLVSGEATLFPNQLLLIPITCSCNGSLYFSKMTYRIKKGDSFYLVSINPFQNLTNYHLVQDLNPSLQPSNLTIGAEVVFPVLCKCPKLNHSDRGSGEETRYLITYVWQPEDAVLPVSNLFGASSDDVVSENNSRNFSAAICLPVLIPAIHSPILNQSRPSLSLSKKQNPKPRWILIVALGIPIFVASLAGFSIYTHFSDKKNRTLLRNGSCLDKSDLNQIKKSSENQILQVKTTSVQYKLLPGVSGYLGKPVTYDAKVIMEATMNLNERYRIGGSTYKAMIDGQIFAVKKSTTAAAADDDELRILQKVNHSNLVKLLGISFDHNGNFFLVYEYVENGSLGKWVRPDSSSSSILLTWSQRLNIAVDIASGLQYMHEHTQPSIAHMNLTMENILLTSNFKAKLSNFSKSRPISSASMLKIDVLAFGFVLLDLLSGKKVKENIEIEEISSILDCQEKKKEKVMKWMDSKLEGFFPIDGALSLLTLSKACISEKPSSRPSMGEVVFHLSVLTHPYSPSDIISDESIQAISPIVAR